MTFVAFLFVLSVLFLLLVLFIGLLLLVLNINLKLIVRSCMNILHVCKRLRNNTIHCKEVAE